MPPRIESYTCDDQQPLEAFFEEAWSGSRFPYDPSGAHEDLRRIRQVYQREDGGFWLLRAGGRIVGTVAIRRLPGNTAELKRFNVLVQCQGKGYGDRLLRHALSHALQAGFSAVRLDTIRIRGPAEHLYQKYGFREIARYNDNPDADLFMELDLTNAERVRFIAHDDARARVARQE